MAQNPRTSDASNSANNGRNTSLTRRSYASSLAAVATAAVSLGASGTAAAASKKYEVIKAENQTITISDGETWENKLIDMTTGQDIVITAEGTEWTIRNIGFRGKNTSGTGTATFGVADTGGNTSTIKNIYMGDGASKGNKNPNGHGQTAFWVNPKHSGHLDFKNVNIQGFADNAIYGSAPGSGSGGTIHIDSSYAANCYVSHFRLATEGSKVTNSSVYVDKEGYAGRGIWGWAPGPIEVKNCQIQMNGTNNAIVAGANGKATNIIVKNTDYDKKAGIVEHSGSNVKLKNKVGTNPKAFVPDGVPKSAKQAARGR